MGSFIHSMYMGKHVPLHFLILLPVWWLLIVYVVGVYGRAVDPSSVLYHAQRNLTSLKQVLEFSLLQDGIDVCLYVSSAGNCSLPVHQHKHMRTLTLARSYCTLLHLHTHTAHLHTCTLTLHTLTLACSHNARSPSPCRTPLGPLCRRSSPLWRTSLSQPSLPSSLLPVNCWQL